MISSTNPRLTLTGVFLLVALLLHWDPLPSNAATISSAERAMERDEFPMLDGFNRARKAIVAIMNRTIHDAPANTALVNGIRLNCLKEGCNMTDSGMKVASSLASHAGVLKNAPMASIKYVVRDRKCRDLSGQCLDTSDCYRQGGRTSVESKSVCGGPVSRQCCFFSSTGDDSRHHLGPSDTLSEHES